MSVVPQKKRIHTINSSEVIENEEEKFPVEAIGPTKVPCSIQGVTSAFGGGILGSVFGLGRGLFKTRVLKELRATAWESASTFALFGGIYAAATCFVTRIRQREDFWNGGLAGCATGVIISWKGGPNSALQSCIGIGVVSAIFDTLGHEPHAEAFPLSIYEERKEGKTGRRAFSRLQKLCDPTMPIIQCRKCKPGFWIFRRK